ncbi:diguanylate cyclase, partial [Citrobacter freundii]
GKNSLNRLIRCVCGKKIGPDPRNFNQRVSLGRNDLLIRTFLRRNVENGTTIPNSYDLKEKMTISIGVYCSKIDDESADKVVSYADAALYEAKNSGRNKVCYYYH